MNQYFKNFILCGDIDHHCLLCQESFRSVADVEKHIRWEKHRRAMKVQTYFPKFKQDHIYKIGSHFYCEICNIVNHNISSLCQHINDEQHKSSKRNPGTPRNTIGQYELGFVIIDKIIISPQLWHGIFDQYCIVCDTAIENEKNHMESQDHLINLIQTKVKIEGKYYYRKINEDKFQCFTCRKLFTSKHMVDHWTSAEHTANICGGDTNIDPKPNKLIESQRLFYDIDVDNTTAVCKECKKSINVNFKEMIVHMKDHSDDKISSKDIKQFKAGSDDSSEEVEYVEVTDHGKRRSELSKYGKQHFIRLIAGGSKGYCMICDSYLSAHKKIFKGHIKGAIHQGILELKSGVNKQQIENDLEFHSIMNCFITHITDINEFLVDGEHCIGNHSMLLMKPINDEPQYMKTKCYCCDTYIHNSKEEDHCKTVEHKIKVIEASVIIVDREFIRKIKPNLYHCGYCNKIIPYWNNMEKHLKTLKHMVTREYNKVSVKFGQSDYIPMFNIIPRKDFDVMYSQLMHVIFE